MESIPEFYPRTNPVQTATVKVDQTAVGEPEILDNIETTAIANLKEKYAGIIAKKVAGAAVKLVVANQVAQRMNSPILGDLTRILLFSADKADLRSWNLLPHDLQILRVAVDPGPHTVYVSPVNGGHTMEKTVHVDAGKKIFVNFRYIP